MMSIWCHISERDAKKMSKYLRFCFNNCSDLSLFKLIVRDLKTFFFSPTRSEQFSKKKMLFFKLWTKLRNPGHSAMRCLT